MQTRKLDRIPGTIVSDRKYNLSGDLFYVLPPVTIDRRIARIEPFKFVALNRK